MSYTIKDIALRSGVSKSTVSRVISGTGYTSNEARQKVLKAVEELQYKPNGVARAMVSKRTNNIGVIIYRQHHPIASHPFYGKILDAILMKAENLNYSVFVTTDQEMSLRSADFMLEKRVDGLILISRLSQEVIGHIDTFNVPYLLVNGTTDKEDIIQIFNQDKQGGRLMADYLYGEGHTRILVIAGPQDHRSHLLRLQGFCEQMNERQIEMTILYSPTSAFADGLFILNEHWEMFERQKPTAVFATNDMLAMGAMRKLMEKGYQIPSDIVVAGFDNIDYSQMCYPSLTTIDVEKMKMGEDAVFLLDQLIQKGSVNTFQVKYEPKLIVRASTSIPLK